MKAIRLSELERLRDALARHEVEYVVLGKTGAFLQGYPDTTQDVDLFIEKTAENGTALTEAREIGFRLGAAEAADIIGGRAMIQFAERAGAPNNFRNAFPLLAGSGRPSPTARSPSPPPMWGTIMACRSSSAAPPRRPPPPIDVDLVFAPDGITCYENARRRGMHAR